LPPKYTAGCKLTWPYP